MTILAFGVKKGTFHNPPERLRRYRRYVYEAGAVKNSEKEYADIIDGGVIEKERENDFNLSRVQRFRYRTLYFSDSGIIGTQAFVSRNYQRFKDIYHTQKEKLPKPVRGLYGIYSLKRLAE